MNAQNKAVQSQSPGTEDRPDSPAYGSQVEPRRLYMTEAEAAYQRGPNPPIAGSVLTSTSPYLNNPYFSHTFLQMALGRNGYDVPLTYHVPDMSRAIHEVTDYQQAQRAIDQEKERNPRFAEFMARRHIPHFDPAKMAHHAPGTLDAAIRSFMVDSGLTMNFVFADTQPINDIEYIRKINGGGHDLHHIIAGFDTTPAGEFAINYMGVSSNAQHFNAEFTHFLAMPLFWVTGTAYTRYCLNHPKSLPVMLQAMQLGLASGLSINTPLMMIDFEHYLDWDLDDIVTDLGIVRPKGLDWAITEELVRS